MREAGQSGRGERLHVLWGHLREPRWTRPWALVRTVTTDLPASRSFGHRDLLSYFLPRVLRC